MKRLVTQFATAVAVTALIGLGSGAAFAQTSTPHAAPSGAPSGSYGAAPAVPGAAPAAPVHAANTATPMKNPLTSEDVSQIEGAAVAGNDGSKIGSVSNVLMDPSTKRIDRLVVAEGGVLGVGAHNVALPVDAFRWDAQNHNFVIAKTADDLKAMPEWQKPQLAENPNDSAGYSTPAMPVPSAGAASGGAPVAPHGPSSGAASGNH